MDTKTKPESRIRNFRCDNPTWERAAERAHENDEALARVIRRLLRRYASGELD